jgi:hypothetical protein
MQEAFAGQGVLAGSPGLRFFRSFGALTLPESYPGLAPLGFILAPLRGYAQGRLSVATLQKAQDLIYFHK